MGGPRMRDAGVTLWPDTALPSVHGLLAPLRQARSLTGLAHRIVRRVEATRPDAVVTIDSPSLFLRLAPRFRAPVLQWVSPQVWAWRPHRVRRVARAVDGVAALFPFEPGLYAGTGLEVRFVGHPLADPRPFVPTEAVGLVAGSRPSERRRLGPVFRRSLQGLPVVEAVPPGGEAVHPDAQVVHGVEHLAGRVSAALVCSGTATLELAVAGIPMVVAYQPDPVTRWVARRVLRVRSIALPNLLLGTSVVPEHVGNLEPTLLRKYIERLRGREGERQREHFRDLPTLLRPIGAVDRVADWVEELAERRKDDRAARLGRVQGNPQ